MPAPTVTPTENRTRRQFLEALLAAPLVTTACGERSTPAQKPPAPSSFKSPIGDEYRFIRHKLQNGNPVIEKGNPVADPDVSQFSDIAGELAGKPFTLSFITSLCGIPEQEGGYLCDRMAITLANISKQDPTAKHVVISALPEQDYFNTNLWGALQKNGLNEKNTILLFPTTDGKVTGLPKNDKLSLDIQKALKLLVITPSDTSGSIKPPAHSGAIVRYNGDGSLCSRNGWRSLINSPADIQTCNAR